MGETIFIDWPRSWYFLAVFKDRLPFKLFSLRKGNYSPRPGMPRPTTEELTIIKTAVKIVRLRNKIEWLDGVREEQGHFPKHCMEGDFSLLNRELEDLEDRAGLLVEVA
ncbi:hypothetical protein LCGC14_1947460 [marine sediment metagenome]|uniref:Uncharacterized protein n=2 Tax=marine sediment metagenome TaxID=412755 RepID=A0A0F9G6W0_9ZZZZ